MATRLAKALGWIAGSGAAIAIIGVLLALQHSPRMSAPVVQGRVEQVRVVADHSSQTKWGSQLIWKAEYKVAYSVAGKDYTVWADSGMRADTEVDLRMALPAAYPACQVWYDPNRPNDSLARCK
jgi:Protein of unknown function (DUF3592)